jgi:PIN domain nuclease of toxin-antitoxin system
MRYLLDTHTLLWWVEGRPLGAEATEVLEDFDNDILVSVVSPWEIAIKESKGRLQAPSDLPQLIADSGFDVLPIRWAHARRIGDLPLLHADPFDRMLVAQALEEDCAIVTRDRRLMDYGVSLVQA